MMVVVMTLQLSSLCGIIGQMSHEELVVSPRTRATMPTRRSLPSVFTPAMLSRSQDGDGSAQFHGAQIHTPSKTPTLSGFDKLNLLALAAVISPRGRVSDQADRRLKRYPFNQVNPYLIVMISQRTHRMLFCFAKTLQSVGHPSLEL
jgi:hypothetical protein